MPNDRLNQMGRMARKQTRRAQARRSGTSSLGHGEALPLGSGHDLRRRPLPSPQRQRSREPRTAVRKLTLNLLRDDQTIKDTMRGKRIQVALSEPILETLLEITIPK